MRKLLTGAFALLLPLTANAQSPQSPDPVFLQRAIAALQSQRNSALDAAAGAQAKAEQLAEELAAAKATIQTLQKKQESPKE